MHSFVKMILFLATGIVAFNLTVYANENIAIREFYVNFVVLSNKPEVSNSVDVEVVKKEIDILNDYFVSEQRGPLVRFRFKSFRTYDDLKNSECEFIKLGDFTGTYNSGYWQELFNACKDPRVVDPTAINFYIYDSYSPKRGFADKTSHGKNNHDRPYIILDWERLSHQIQSPEEHEMGHAFGLGHVCLPGAKLDTSTNIMTSKECGKGSGGKRDVGFDPRQSSIILRNAEEIAGKLSGK